MRRLSKKEKQGKSLRPAVRDYVRSKILIARLLQCDGQRPTCTACRARSVVCVYEVASGLSRSADMRQKNTMLSSRIVELEQLHNKLRFQDDAMALTTLVRLRAGEDIASIIYDEPDAFGFVPS